MIKIDKIIKQAHRLLREVIVGKTTVDLTAGNGHDTLFLAKHSKFVYSFDIQEQAISNSQTLSQEYKNIKYICDGHQYILDYIDKPIKGAIFNLGYLPRGDKQITTLPETTITALDGVLQLLEPKGRCIIIVYSGHENGECEARTIEEYVSSLDQKLYEVLKYQFVNQKNNPPYLIAIERI